MCLTVTGYNRTLPRHKPWEGFNWMSLSSFRKVQFFSFLFDFWFLCHFLNQFVTPRIDKRSNEGILTNQTNCLSGQLKREEELKANTIHFHPRTFSFSSFLFHFCSSYSFFPFFIFWYLFCHYYFFLILFLSFMFILFLFFFSNFYIFSIFIASSSSYFFHLC